QFGGEGGGLVVLHGDHTAGVVLAGTCQFGDAFAALRVVPGVGQLHAIAVRNDPLVGGAEPALSRVLVIGMQHRVGITVPVVATFPAWRWQQTRTFAAVREAHGDFPAD